MGGNKIPSIWKREIARILENIDEIKNVKVSNDINLIDIIRIVHPKGDDNSIIKKLLKDGLFNYEINKFQLNEKQSFYLENKKYIGKDILTNLYSIIKNIIEKNINDLNYINSILDDIYSNLIINIK